MPFLHVKTGIRGRPNDSLLREKGGTGFPTLMFLDADGRRLLTHGGPRTVDGFEESLEVVRELRELERRAEEGDEDARTELFLRGLKLGWYDLAEARERFASLKEVSRSQRNEIEALLVDLEVRELAEKAGGDLDARIAAGKRFAELYDEKVEPSSEEALYAFWTLMADHAEHERDRRLFKRIVREFEDTLPMGYARNRKTLESLELRLRDFPRD